MVSFQQCEENLADPQGPLEPPQGHAAADRYAGRKSVPLAYLVIQ